MELIARGSKHNHKFTLTIEESSQSIVDNTSTLVVGFKLSEQPGWNWANWGNSITYEILIGDNRISGSIPKYGNTFTSNPLILVSGKELVIPHNDDGTKSVDVAFSIVDRTRADYTCGNASASQVLTLTTIPRASEFYLEPNDVLTKGTVLSVNVTQYLNAVDVLQGFCNGYTAFSFTTSNTPEYTKTKTYEDIVTACHLEANSTYNLLITIETRVGSDVLGTREQEIKISTGTMPLSVVYRDGEYGISFGKKATEVNKLKSYYSLEIGDSSTDLTLLLNGEEVGGSINITANEDQIVGKYNGKDLYLRVIRWSSGQVVATGTQIGSLGKVDEVVQLNFTMTPSNKSNFWTGSVRDGNYFHQGVQVERSTGNVKVYYQDGWGSGTLVTVWVMYTKG